MEMESRKPDTVMGRIVDLPWTLVAKRRKEESSRHATRHNVKRLCNGKVETEEQRGSEKCLI